MSAVAVTDLAPLRSRTLRYGTLPPVPSAVSSPRISIIVLAHSRREFLREAIESILRQDYPRPDFEILVVKNFADPELDSFLAESGAESVLSSEVPAPRKVIEGLQRSQGSIVTFLEDDDVYEPGRLRAIAEAFRDSPKLGFYRNRFRYIGSDGRPLDSSAVRAFGLRRTPRMPSILLDDAEKPGDARWLGREFPDFNISSCAIDRAVLLPTLPFLARMSSTIDTMLFFAGLVAPRSVLFDGTPFTRYRVHAQNASLAGGGPPAERESRLRDVAHRTGEDYGIVREYVAASGRPKFLDLIDARIWVNQLTVAFRNPTATRRDFARLLGNLPRYFDTFPVQEDILGVVGLGPFLASPALGRRLYRRQMSVR